LITLTVILTIEPDPYANTNHNPNPAYLNKPIESYQTILTPTDTVGRVARCPVFDRTVQFFSDLSGQKYDAKPDN